MRWVIPVAAGFGAGWAGMVQGHAGPAARSVSDLETTATTAVSAPFPPVAPDLQLTPEAVRDSEVLAHWGWGFFLQLQDDENASVDHAPVPPPSPFALQLIPAGVDPFPALPGVGNSGEKGSASASTSPPAPAAAAVGPRRPDAGEAAGLPAALTHFREVLKLDPENREAFELFAGVLLENLDRKVLIRELRALVALHPASRQLNLALAEALATNEQRPEAIRTLQAALAARHWSDPAMVLRLTSLLWGENRIDESGGVLERAQAEGGLDRHFLIRTAAAVHETQCSRLKTLSAWSRFWHRWHGRRHAAAALAMLRSGKDRPFPDADAVDASDCLLLANALLDLERTEDALATLRAARERFPDDALVLMLEEAELLVDKGRKTEAAALLPDLDRQVQAAVEPAIRKPAEDAEDAALRRDAARQVCAAAVRLAHLHIQAGQPESSIPLLERVLPLREDQWEARLLLANLYLYGKQPERALTAAAAVRPDIPLKFMLLSKAALRLNRLEEAGRFLATAEELALKEPSSRFFDRDYYFYYSMLCEKRGMLDRAVEKAEKALSLEPDDAEAQNFLGYLLADHNRDLARAEALILKAVKAEPENVAYLDSLAWVWFRQGKFAEAYKKIQKALKLEKEAPDAVILEHAGDIAAALRRPDEARTWWESSLKNGAESSDALRKKLQDVSGAAAAVGKPAPAP